MRQVLQSHENQPATRNPLLLPPPPPQSGTEERRGKKRTQRKQAEGGGGDDSPGGSSEEWEPYPAASPASREVVAPQMPLGGKQTQKDLAVASYYWFVPI